MATPSYDLPDAISIGKHRELWVITGSFAIGTYATGGVALDLTGKIKTAKFVSIEPGSGYVCVYDYTNKKVKVYYADYDAVADGVLIEVADDTDLSAVTCRFLAVGLRDV